MKISLNGKPEELENGTTIAKLLQVKKIRPEVVAIELNESVLERAKYPVTVLKEGDKLELVYYMGGGTSDGKKCGEKLADSVIDLIGNTPLVRLNKIADKSAAQILAKLEMFNPGGSVKDRICLSMIEDAEKKGLIGPGSTIIEATSGNTGIGLAVVCAVRGYRCVLTMPESMSLERIYILRSLGAEVHLTPNIEGMQGSMKKAEELQKKTHKSFILQQFSSEANPEIHRKTTAPEILKATAGRIDALVATVGTGGTITGVGEVLKAHNPAIKIVAVEPKTSAVLSGHKPGPHKIQGIGAGFIPVILNKAIIDEIIPVTDNEAFNTMKLLAQKEGIFGGISAGAAVWAAKRVAKELGQGKTVVVIIPDTGERYFSMEQYFTA